MLEKRVIFEEDENILEILESKTENCVCLDISIIGESEGRVFWINSLEDYVKIRTEMDRIACEIWEDLKSEL